MKECHHAPRASYDSLSFKFCYKILSFATMIIFLVSLCFIEISVLNANSVDTCGTPQNAASGLGLHYLPITLLGASRLKSVNQTASIISKYIQIYWKFYHLEMKIYG